MPVIATCVSRETGSARNFCRSLPAHYNPTIVDALLRLGELAGESQSLIDTMVHDLAQRCCATPDKMKFVWI